MENTYETNSHLAIILYAPSSNQRSALKLLHHVSKKKVLDLALLNYFFGYICEQSTAKSKTFQTVLDPSLANPATSEHNPLIQKSKLFSTESLFSPEWKTFYLARDIETRNTSSIFRISQTAY